MAWDPSQYLRFEGHRIRPAIELLQRINLDAPDQIVDLGCGTGNTTALLRNRWPEADVTGVDNSGAMLAIAEHDYPDVNWVDATIETWEPNAPMDLIFANAALHWVDDHDQLIPRLASFLKPGGVLAFQVPDNVNEPTHQLAYDTAFRGEWADVLGPLERPWPVRPPVDYARILTPLAQSVDAWSTTYVQSMAGKNPVAEWTKGSVLRPMLSLLTDAQGEQFFATYAARILEAYPPESDGSTLLTFRRVFAIAVRSDET